MLHFGFQFIVVLEREPMSKVQYILFFFIATVALSSISVGSENILAGRLGIFEKETVVQASILPIMLL